MQIPVANSWKYFLALRFGSVTVKSRYHYSFESLFIFIFYVILLLVHFLLVFFLYVLFVLVHQVKLN